MAAEGEEAPREEWKGLRGADAVRRVLGFSNPQALRVAAVLLRRGIA